ncbi:MAG: TolC family protein [Cyclobacteriaceae bacterium]
MKRYYLFLLTALTSAGSVFAQSALDEYVEYAVQNNPGLKASYSSFEAALEKIPQMSTLEDPNFKVSTFGQMVETRTGQQMARFSLEQMFPWFGTLTEQKDAAALNAEAMLEAFKAERNALIFEVKESYYPLYELDEAIRLNEENLQILSTFKTLAVSRFQNGTGKLSDALRVDLMTNDINTDINILREKRKALVISFNKLLNREEDAEVIVDKPSELSSMALVNRDSLVHNPQLEQLRKKVLAAQAQERLASKQGMPKLGVGFEYAVTQARPDMTFSDNGKDAYMAMFSVSLPIYRKKYKASVRESQLMQTSYTALQQQVENDLIAAYEKASFEVTRVGQQLALYQKQVAQTKQIVSLLITAVSNNNADFEEILEMQRELLKYEMLEITARREYAISVARIEYLTSN